MCKRAYVAWMSLAVFAAHAEQPLTGERVKHVVATIEAVNDEGRALVLRGDGESRLLIVAGPEIHNFDEISAGDRVSARYREAVAIEVLPSDSESKPPKRSKASKRASDGQGPAIGMSSVISTIVTIESIDPSFATVTFKRPDGFVRTAAVESPKTKELIRGLRRGDQVQITYSEAVALHVKAAG